MFTRPSSPRTRSWTLLVVLAALLVIPVQAQNETQPGQTVAPAVEEGWKGCVAFDEGGEPELVRLGKPMTICIVLASNANWNTAPPDTARYLRLSFQPKVDEYSRFHVPESYKDLIQAQQVRVYDGSNNVTIHVSAQKALSFQRMFYQHSGQGVPGKIFPFLTAIIDVHEGIVRGVSWDDASLFCGNDRCEENTYDYNGNLGDQESYKQPTKACYIDQAECDAVSMKGETACDIMVYVVWTGTDADKKVLQSSAFRYSSFPVQEIQNQISHMLGDIPFLGSVPGTTPEATTDQAAGAA